MKIEAGRADLTDLGRKAAKEMLANDEERAKKAAWEGPQEARKETWGIIAEKVATGEWKGRVIGDVPGADREVVLWNRTCDGLVAMAHRKFLELLTSSGVEAGAARRRAAEAEFYIATVL